MTRELGEKRVQELSGASRLILKGCRTPEETVFIVCSVPWLPLISHFLPCFKTLRINVCYWRENVPGSYGVSQAFPCFLGLDLGPAPHHIYGLPSREYPGLMKVSARLEG